MPSIYFKEVQRIAITKYMEDFFYIAPEGYAIDGNLTYPTIKQGLKTLQYEFGWDLKYIAEGILRDYNVLIPACILKELEE